MLRHASQAVPWVLVAVTGVLVLLLMEGVRHDPLTMWPLQGVAVGLLAGAVGWCLDEPAAAVVDPSPRSLAWRTSARGTGILALVLAWSLAVWWSRDSLFGQAWVVHLQGVVACLVGAAWVTWRRAAGEASPGQRWALTVVPVVTTWALVRPFEERLPLFPFAGGGENGSWQTGATLWAILGLLAIVALGVLAAESRRFRHRDPSSRRDLRPAGRATAGTRR